MNNLANRKRRKIGVTDYYHRKKTLTNHKKILRLCFGKKNKYFYCALIRTHDVAKSDLCLNYFESRWIEPTVKNNRCTAYLFGQMVSKTVEERLESLLKEEPDMKLVLDLGRRKKLATGFWFYEGVCSFLPASLRPPHKKMPPQPFMDGFRFKNVGGQ